VYEVVGCLQNEGISALTHVLTSSFLQSMIARLVLDLLKSRDTIALLQWSIAFERISSLAFTNIFECIKTVNVNVTNLNHFLLVACPCLQRILLQFTI